MSLVSFIARRPPPIGWPSMMHRGLRGEGFPGGRKWCTPVAAVASADSETSPGTTLIRAGDSQGPRSATTGTSDRPDLWDPHGDIRPSVQDLLVYRWSAIHRHTSRWDVGGPVHDGPTRERLPRWTVAGHHVVPAPHVAAVRCVSGEGIRQFPIPPLPAPALPAPPLRHPANLASVWIPYRLLPRGAVQS